ncbi:MAG: hypothetical protein IAB75_03245 [Bacteroidetes bacterium]|uniref:Fibronectin type-III domain-containing protein n=1 Tax=Candidatus Cryptobacteroides avicola TaxID=2840757 RepID=A0A940DQP4_9BACT|nr:hypothetical protein [Candidatus Cryptobacteroides avicola]
MNTFVKTTRALLALLPAVLLSVQCSQEELAGPEKPQVSGTVTLTIKNAEPTKTYIDGETGKVYWTDGEVIIINGEVYRIVVDETDPTVATVPDVVASGDYFVVYNDYYPTSDPEEGRLLVNFPAEQTYREDSFSDYSNIMAGYSTTTDIRMYNIGGVVKFGVTGNCTLTSLSFSTKDGSPVAGYLLLPEDQLLNGELGDNSVFYENPDYGITASSTINITAYTADGGIAGIALSSEPTDFYIVVPAKEYAEGFYITMEDSEGNVAVQSTTGAKTIGRSEMLVLPDFEFTARTLPALGPTEAGPASVTYTVTADPGTPLKTVLVSKGTWDYYANDAYAGQETQLAKDLSITYGSETFFTDGTGEYSKTDTTSFNVSGKEVALTAGTEYKLIVSLADNTTAKGTPAVFDVATAAPTGEAPEITLSELENDRPHAQLTPVIKTTNAVSIKYAMFSSSSAEGKTDEELMELYGTEATAEQVEQANSTGGLTLTYSNLPENTSFTFLVAATGAGGAVSAERLVLQTDYYLDPDATWSTVSTEASMDCNIFGGAIGLGGFGIYGLTVEKMDGKDIFRVLQPITIDTYPDAEYNGLTFIDGGYDSYLTIDATDHSAVKLERDYNPLGVIISLRGGTTEAGLSSAAYYYENSSFGTYDPDAGIINLGYVSVVDDMYIYGSSEGTVLYLNIPIAGGVSTEDFTINEDTAW